MGTAMLMRNTTAARLLLMLLLLPRHATAAKPVLLLLLLLLLPRHATVARPVLLLLLLPRHAAAARPVLLLLLLLPRHATAAKYHTVVPSLASASLAPSVPKTTADDKSMRVRRFRRRSRRRPLFRNSVGLPSGEGGTDGVF